MVFLYDRTEVEAATALGYRSGEGLKKRRLKGDLPDYLYVKFGYRSVRYCLPLLLDWQQNTTDLEAQARARQQLQNSLVSNLPAKRGRKAA